MVTARQHAVLSGSSMSHSNSGGAAISCGHASHEGYTVSNIERQEQASTSLSHKMAQTQAAGMTGMHAMSYAIVNRTGNLQNF